MHQSIRVTAPRKAQRYQDQLTKVLMMPRLGPPGPKCMQANSPPPPPRRWIFYLLRLYYISHMESKRSFKQYISRMNRCRVNYPCCKLTRSLFK